MPMLIGKRNDLATAAVKMQQEKTRSATPSRDNAWIKIMTKIGWYSKLMPSEEKRLILKLDLSILIFGCLSFFTKYLDQQSLTNAYVSGMREDLQFQGNQLNYITATFWASYCTFMIPACYFLTHYPANIVLPALEIGWGLSTFGLAWSQNVETVYAMRFFTGVFECCSFTGTIYVIGSWYKPSEIERRTALFFIASPLGTIFAEYLQAAAYTNLNGTYSLWLFIVDAIITIPIALLGFFIFPDVPSRRQPRWLSTTDLNLARQRLYGLTSPPQLKLSRDIFKRVLTRYHFYAFVTQWSLMDQNFAPYSQPFSLHLKAKSNVYSVVRINTLPNVATAIRIVSALGSGLVADKTGHFWIPTLAVTFPVLIGISMLVAWDVSEMGRLAAFMIIGFEGAVSPMTMGWATVEMSGDAEERAVVTASRNAIGQAIAAGTQIVQFPATGAPRFKGGFISCLITTVGQILMLGVIMKLSQRDKRRLRNKASRPETVVVMDEEAAKM